MRISRKLVFLTTLTSFTFLIAVAVLFTALSLMMRINEEQNTLQNLSDAVNELLIGALLLGDAPMNKIDKPLSEEIDTYNQTFKDLETLVWLPRISSEVKAAVGKISVLQALNQSRLVKFEQAFGGIVLKLNENGIGNYMSSINNLEESNMITSRGLQDEFSYPVIVYGQGLSTLVEGLETTNQTIVEQRAFIRNELKRVTDLGLLISVLMIVVALVVSLSITQLFVRSISKNINLLHSSVEYLKQGRIGIRNRITSKDELGELGTNLNSFSETLTDSIVRIADEVDLNRNAQQEMSGATEESSASTRQIGANVESINRQIGILETSVSQSSQAVSEIVSGIETTDQELAHQHELVERSSAAVTQMIASIQNIGRVSEKSTKATEALLNAADYGNERLDETTQVITQVQERINGIRGIIDIIQGIASSTNLLAMNAAIEAAHAGESGRGFSVVADEIRKLAEASSENSNEVGRILEEMIENVQAADEAGSSTREAFGNLNSIVSDVQQAYDTINMSIRELEAGGGEILGSIEELNEASSRVSDSSEKMRDQSSIVGSSMEAVQRVSGEVNSGMREINQGLHEVNSAMEHLLNLSRQVSEIGDRVNKAITVFTIEESSEDIN